MNRRSLGGLFFFRRKWDRRRKEEFFTCKQIFFFLLFIFIFFFRHSGKGSRDVYTYDDARSTGNVAARVKTYEAAVKYTSSFDPHIYYDPWKNVAERWGPPLGRCWARFPQTPSLVPASTRALIPVFQWPSRRRSAAFISSYTVSRTARSGE